MRSAARLVVGLALCLVLVACEPLKKTPPRSNRASSWRRDGSWSRAGGYPAARPRRCIRDFEGFAVSSTVIMLNMQALKDLPRPVQWLIYYHECGHILYGPSETAADCYAVRRARREGWLSDAVARRYLRGVQHRRPRRRCTPIPSRAATS